MATLVEAERSEVRPLRALDCRERRGAAGGPGGIERRPERQAETLLSNFESIKANLAAGSVVVIEPSRIRARSLPLAS